MSLAEQVRKPQPISQQLGCSGAESRQPLTAEAKLSPLHVQILMTQSGTPVHSRWQCYRATLPCNCVTHCQLLIAAKRQKPWFPTVAQRSIAFVLSVTCSLMRIRDSIGLLRLHWLLFSSKRTVSNRDLRISGSRAGCWRKCSCISCGQSATRKPS